MREFKFFQKEVKETLDIIDGETYSTASFNADTPDGHLYRRHLYHTNLPEYERQRGMLENGVITQQQYNLNRDMFAEQEIVIRRRIDNDNQIRLFQTTTVTTVNPKWWMKVKMFFQKIKINAVIETHSEAMGIFFIAVTVTFIFGLLIAKVLNVW